MQQQLPVMTVAPNMLSSVGMSPLARQQCAMLEQSKSLSRNFSEMNEASAESGADEMGSRVMPAEVTVIEKLVEQQGLSAQEIQLLLQAERARTSTALQQIIADQTYNVGELVREEIQKVASTVTSLATSTTERFTKIEADQTTRNSNLQSVIRDVDVVQSQLATFEQFRTKCLSNLEQVGREREELRSLLDSVTKDVRSSTATVLSGLEAQKDKQQRTETVLAGIQSDLETAITETTNLKLNIVASAQKDLFAVQKEQQQKLDSAAAELRRQMQQSIEVIRSESANELQMLRQTSLTALAERLRVLENTHTEQDLKDLTRMMQTERSARTDLSQAFEAFRVSNQTTCSQLQEDMESLPDKMSRIARAILEETTVRQRTMDLEQNLSDLKVGVSRMTADLEKQFLVTQGLERDTQEMGQALKTEQSVQSQLSQIFDADRQAQIKTVAELRAEIQRVMEKLIDFSKTPAEDRYARDCCEKVEQGLIDFRSEWNHKVAELRGGAAGPQDVEELKQSVQMESAARRDLGQAVDQYRLSQLQASTDLRADMDRLLERFGKMDSQQSSDLRAELERSLARIIRLESMPKDLEKVLERLNRLEVTARTQNTTYIQSEVDRVVEKPTGLAALKANFRANADMESQGTTAKSTTFSLNSTFRSGYGTDASPVANRRSSWALGDTGASSIRNSPWNAMADLAEDTNVRSNLAADGAFQTDLATMLDSTLAK